MKSTRRASEDHWSPNGVFAKMAPACRRDHPLHRTRSRSTSPDPERIRKGSRITKRGGLRLRFQQFFVFFGGRNGWRGLRFKKWRDLNYVLIIFVHVLLFRDPSLGRHGATKATNISRLACLKFSLSRPRRTKFQSNRRAKTSCPFAFWAYLMGYWALAARWKCCAGLRKV